VRDEADSSFYRYLLAVGKGKSRHSRNVDDLNSKYMSENSDNQHICQSGGRVKMAAGTELQKNG
jgi:hypothetical protein